MTVGVLTVGSLTVGVWTVNVWTGVVTIGVVTDGDVTVGRYFRRFALSAPCRSVGRSLCWRRVLFNAL